MKVFAIWWKKNKRSKKRLWAAFTTRAEALDDIGMSRKPERVGDESFLIEPMELIPQSRPIRKGKKHGTQRKR